MTTAEVFKKYHAGEADSHVLYVPLDIDHDEEAMSRSLELVSFLRDRFLTDMINRREQQH